MSEALYMAHLSIISKNFLSDLLYMDESSIKGLSFLTSASHVVLDRMERRFSDENKYRRLLGTNNPTALL